MRIDKRGMSQAEWLKERRKGLGGTDAAAVCKLNPYKTPLDVYNEKVSLKPLQQTETAAMLRGKMLEDLTARWWASDYGFKIQRDNTIRIHKKHPFLIADLDRQILSGNGKGTGVLEVTTTSRRAFESWQEDGAPIYKFCQVQHYLNVTGYSWAALAVLIVDDWQLKSIPIEPDQEFIEMMEEYEVKFWLDYVQKRIPPDPSTSAEVVKRWPRHTDGKLIEATSETFNIWDRACSVRNQIKQLEKEKEELETTLKNIIQDAEGLLYQGQLLATFKQSKDTKQFDREKFRAEHPDLYEKYLTARPGTRRFYLKAIKE